MRRCAITLVAAALTVGVAAPASALELESFTTTSTSNVAAAHPDVSTSFSFVEGSGTARDVRLDLPPGLIGNPNAVPRCTQADFAANTCQAAAQVGKATLVAGGITLSNLPVWNLVAGSQEPALLGIKPFVTPDVFVRFSSRTTSDYGLTTAIMNIPDALPLLSSTLTLFGVPADENGSGAPRVPFMTNPTGCGPAPATKLTAHSYEEPTIDVLGSALATAPGGGDPEPVVGCDTVPFAPGITVTPETTQADTPSAYSVELTVPQSNDPDGRATAHLHTTRVTFPPGLGISPSAADGLAACSDEQLGAGTNDEPTCPDASKVGTVAFDVPVLQTPIQGDIYLGSPTPQSPFRVFLVGRGSGLVIKLRGLVLPDADGRLTTVFDDNPQVPFTSFRLRFKGGPRAILANPITCGPVTVMAELTPWSSLTPATPSSTFAIDGCGPPAFTPGFNAGGSNTQAGADTSFALTLTRPEGQPELGGLHVSMPPGLLGRLNAVPMCPSAAATAGTCDPASEVGSSLVTAGPGSQPVSFPGKVYFAEPQHPGDVAALSIVTPAVAGPFDLGKVIVTAALRLRPEDSGLDVVSDPLPTVVGGIRLRIRRVGIDITRQGFMFNPTSCQPAKVSGTIGSASGDTAPVSAPFGVTGCSALPFGPDFAARMAGTQQTKYGRSPAFTTTITQPPGDANLRLASVTLPRQVGVNLNSLSNACLPAQYKSDACPAASKVGEATAVTPVLPKPLSGPIYLVAADDDLPHLTVQLRGQIAVDLIGKVALDPRLVTTFDHVPDVPISRFSLALHGGTGGALRNGVNLCRSRTPFVHVMFVSHSGKRLDRRVKVGVDGCPAKRGSRARRHRRAKAGHHGRRARRPVRR